MSSHLWLAQLDEETVQTFATAFTFSAKKRGYRVSTERFLAALPVKFKERMAKLCADAGNECKLTVPEADLPAPELPADWQERICFSTCIEATLQKCTECTSLWCFLKLLCSTAIRLHFIIDRNMPLDAYLKNDDARPMEAASLRVPAPDRWRTHDATSTLSADDLLDSDVLRIIMSKASSVEALRKYKVVSKCWRAGARHTLCDSNWLVANQVNLHTLLKKGTPSPQLALALAAREPGCMNERDGEGLIPLQYAAAYRMDPSLVIALRQATASQVPAFLPDLAWLGLAWLGLAWLGLVWLGLARLGLAWLGLIDFGRQRPFSTQMPAAFLPDLAWLALT